MTLPRPGWRPLAVVLAGAGVLHFAKPKPYTRLVPAGLGNATAWVYGSGVAELVCAAGLAVPRTRRSAGLATAALFVVVFPGNIKMAVDAARSPRASSRTKAITKARLPLQAPLVWWALDVANRSGGPRRGDGA